MLDQSKRQMAKPPASVLPDLLRLDRETGKLFWKQRMPLSENSRWNARFAGKEAFACMARPGRASGSVLGYQVCRPAVVWALVHGNWPERMVAHINGDTLDDRPDNLALRDRGKFARSARCDNRSGIKGVSALGSKWRARLKVGGRLVSLGTFDTKGEAGKAVERAHKLRSNVA